VGTVEPNKKNGVGDFWKLQLMISKHTVRKRMSHTCTGASVTLKGVTILKLI